MLFKNIKIFKNRKIIMLLTASSAAVLCVLCISFFSLRNFYQRERADIAREAGFAVEHLEKHTALMIRQIDVLLHSVRMTYLRDHSVIETEKFINNLHYDTAVIENIFLADKHGFFIIPQGLRTPEKKISDRDYFRYHQSNPTDSIFISTVEKGKISEKYRFRVSRRITNLDGSFGGVIVITVVPSSLLSYYHELQKDKENVVSLIGMHDNRLRARVPEPSVEAWSAPTDSLMLFDKLKITADGNFESKSPIDHVTRFFYYKKVDDLPLVLLVGYSKTDIDARVYERKIALIAAMTTVLAFVLWGSYVLYRLMIANQKLHAALLEIEALSVRDQLTSCYNRRYFDHQMNHEIARAQRFKHNLSVIMCDIDHFKKVNDKYGHLVGDSVLKSVSSILLNRIRQKVDYVVRYGGEEFLLVLPQTDLKGAVALAENLRSALEEKTIVSENNFIKVTASFGVTAKNYNANKEERTQKDFLKLADQLLYRAKRDGRNRVVFQEMI